MSRARVRDAITSDAVLGQLFTDDNVKTNYTAQQMPSEQPMFLNLVWDGERWNPRVQRRDPRVVTIWVHMSRNFSTDYSHIDGVIERLDAVLTDIIDSPGADGYAVTQIEAGDKSRDLRDRGYDTLCRSASYKVLSRKT